MVERIRSFAAVVPLFAAMVLHVALLFAWGLELGDGSPVPAAEPSASSACLAQLVPAVEPR